MSDSRFRWITGAILLLAALAYWPALTAPYYFDDFTLFSDPAMLPGGETRLFDLARTRTLTYLSFFASFRGGGQNPAVDHAANLAIFGALIAVAAGLYRRLIGAPAALAAAAVAAFHPLMSEAVVYVFARATLLSALFVLLSWSSWERGRTRRAVGFAILAMASKEAAVALPLFLVAFELLYRRISLGDLRALWRPLSAMAAAAAFFTLRVVYAANVTPDAGALIGLDKAGPLSYLQAQGRAVWLYIKLLVWPTGLNFDHEMPVVEGWDVQALTGWVLLAAAAAACAYVFRGERYMFFVVGAGILLAPTSSIAPLADAAAERRMAASLLCLAPLAGIALTRAFAGRRLLYATGAIVAALGVLTYQRASVWQEAEKLWGDTVAKSPSKARPKLHLSRALAVRGAITAPRQEELLRQAVEAEPQSAGAWGELGLFLLRLRNIDEATEALSRARDLAPHDPSLTVNLGVALASEGRMDEGEAFFRQVLSTSPCHFDARNNLLFVLRSRGDLDEARAVAKVPADCVLPPNQHAALAQAADF